jgi:hypothetical protein
LVGADDTNGKKVALDVDPRASDAGVLRTFRKFAATVVVGREPMSRRPPSHAAIDAAVRSAEAFTGSSPKCAYRCVVFTSAWPSIERITRSESPPIAGTDANEWRRS